MRIIRFLSWCVVLVLIAFVIWEVPPIWNGLLAIGAGVGTIIAGLLLSPQDVVAKAGVVFVTQYLVLAILIMLIAGMIWWFIKYLTRNAKSLAWSAARNTGRAAAAHALGLFVFFVSIAYALLEITVLWGDVRIGEYMFIAAWNPDRIYNWMIVVLAVSAGWYVIVTLLPLALSSFIGFGFAMLNVISSMLTGGLWVAALIHIFGWSDARTTFRVFALEVFSFAAVADLLVIMIIFRVRARGFIASSEEAVVHGGHGPPR